MSVVSFLSINGKKDKFRSNYLAQLDSFLPQILSQNQYIKQFMVGLVWNISIL